MDIKTTDGKVPYFPYKVVAGNVVLAYEEQGYKEKNGIEEPMVKQKMRNAVIVAIGGETVVFSESRHNIDANLVVGRKVLMPTSAKQEFVLDGKTFYICHYLDIKVIDPLDDEDCMVDFMTQHFESMPEAVQAKFMAKYADKK